MTKQERAYVSRLRRLLKDMPASLELIVRYNVISVCAEGSRQEHFDAHGDADNTPELCSVETLGLRIYPGGESL